MSAGKESHKLSSLYYYSLTSAGQHYRQYLQEDVNSISIYKRNKDGRLVTLFHSMLLAISVCIVSGVHFYEKKEFDFLVRASSRYFEDQW